MTQHASIQKTEQGFKVESYKELRCPACGRCLLQSAGILKIEIVCARCKARVKVEGEDIILVKSPRKLTGKLLNNWKKLAIY